MWTSCGSAAPEIGRAMFIELADNLRCPRTHEESALVAAVAERSGRDIVRGTLGCPVCGAEFPIENGIAIFGGAFTQPPASSEPYGETDDDAAVRCAAMLDLYDGAGLVVLAGAWTRVARPLLDLAPVSLLIVDPPPTMPLNDRASGVRTGDVLPIARGSARGIAMDDPPSDRWMASAARAVRAGGRLLAAANVPVPPGFAVHARDDRHWLAEAEATIAPVPLTVARPRRPA